MESNPGKIFPEWRVLQTVLHKGQKVNVNLKYVMKAWRSGRGIAVTNMASAVEGAGWLKSGCGRFTPRGELHFHFTVGRVAYEYGKFRHHRHSNPGPSSL
jgi:hypothetical protein